MPRPRSCSRRPMTMCWRASRSIPRCRAEEPTRVVSSEWEQIVDSQTSVMPPAAPAAMPPAIPPTDADGNADGSGGRARRGSPSSFGKRGRQEPHEAHCGHCRRRARDRAHAGGIAWWSSSRRNNAQRNAYTLCQNTRDSYDDAHTALAAALKDAMLSRAHPPIRSPMRRRSTR